MVQPPSCDGPRQRSCQPHKFSNSFALRSGSVTVILTCSSWPLGMEISVTCVRPAKARIIALPNLQPQVRLRSRAKNLHRDRSEEHTSELQSLMRISYAVLCLKKKKIEH